MSASPVLVIGYGNPLRGDDGLGWHAAQQLQMRLPDLDICVCHQLTPELAEPLSRAARAAFVDVTVDHPPGVLAVIPLRPEPGARLGLTHQFTPTTLLGLARTLYGRAPDAALFSLGAQSFDFTDELSPPVTAALPGLIRQLEDWVRGEERMAGERMS